MTQVMTRAVNSKILVNDEAFMIEANHTYGVCCVLSVFNRTTQLSLLNVGSSEWIAYDTPKDKTGRAVRVEAFQVR